MAQEAKPLSAAQRALIHTDACKVWALIIDPNYREIPVPHDCYLKCGALFALRRTQKILQVLLAAETEDTTQRR